MSCSGARRSARGVGAAAAAVSVVVAPATAALPQPSVLFSGAAAGPAALEARHVELKCGDDCGSPRGPGYSAAERGRIVAAREAAAAAVKDRGARRAEELWGIKEGSGGGGGTTRKQRARVSEGLSAPPGSEARGAGTPATPIGSALERSPTSSSSGGGTPPAVNASPVHPHVAPAPAAYLFARASSSPAVEAGSVAPMCAILARASSSPAAAPVSPGDAVGGSSRPRVDVAFLFASPLMYKLIRGGVTVVKPLDRINFDRDIFALDNALRHGKGRRAVVEVTQATLASFVSAASAHPRVLHFSGHGKDDALESEATAAVDPAAAPAAAMAASGAVDCGAAAVAAAAATTPRHGTPPRPAQLSGTGHSFLVLEGADDACAVLADGTLLNKVFGGYPDDALVFLSACSSRRVGEHVARAGARHVVATSRTVTDADAKDFTEYFYRALFAGKSIAAAFSAANGTFLSSRPGVADAGFVLLPEDDAAALHGGCVPFPALPEGFDEFVGLAHDAISEPVGGVIGRCADIEKVVKLLLNAPDTDTRPARALLVCGEAGVGKSAVAAAVARYLSVRRVFKAGVVWVDCAAAYDAASLAYCVSERWSNSRGGEPRGPTIDIGQFGRSSIGGSLHALLVLDNVDAVHNSGDLDGAVKALLTECGQLRVLLTMRCSVIDVCLRRAATAVGPMDQMDAARLFDARTRRQLCASDFVVPSGPADMGEPELAWLVQRSFGGRAADLVDWAAQLTDPAVSLPELAAQAASGFGRAADAVRAAREERNSRAAADRAALSVKTLQLQVPPPRVVVVSSPPSGGGGGGGGGSGSGTPSASETAMSAAAAAAAAAAAE
jgi:hypothetical protein